MQDEFDFVESHENEYAEINDSLVVPAFRLFCRALNLPFHFWDELPEGSLNAEIGLKEYLLDKDALNIFNRLKPDLNFYKERIVRFQITSWDGDFTYDSWPIQEFLEVAADNLYYLRKLEKRLEIIIFLVATLCGVAALFGAINLLGPLGFWEYDWSGILELATVLFSVGVGILVGRSLQVRDRKILDDQRLAEIVERLNALRRRLAEIRGDAPNPILAQGLGHLVLDELQDEMKPHEVGCVVRSLRTALNAIPADEHGPEQPRKRKD